MVSVLPSNTSTWWGKPMADQLWRKGDDGLQGELREGSMEEVAFEWDLE